MKLHLSGMNFVYVFFFAKDGVLFKDYIDFSSLYPSYLNIYYWYIELLATEKNGI